MSEAVVPDIRTARLDLAVMSLAFLQAIEAGDLGTASREVGAPFPPSLAEDLVDFARLRIPDLAADPRVQPWLGRVMLERGPLSRRTVVGSAGFHGPPDADGRVEIGYGVEAGQRRRGLATEAVNGLLDWALGQGVSRFRASVAPTNVASLAIVRRFGFREVGSRMDEIDGEELVFEMDRG